MCFLPYILTVLLRMLFGLFNHCAPLIRSDANSIYIRITNTWSNVTWILIFCRCEDLQSTQRLKIIRRKKIDNFAATWLCNDLDSYHLKTDLHLKDKLWNLQISARVLWYQSYLSEKLARFPCLYWMRRFSS